MPGAGTAPHLPAQQHPPTAVLGPSAPPACLARGEPPKATSPRVPPVPALPGCWGSGAVPRAGSARAGDRTGAGSPGWEPALPGTGPFPSMAQPGTRWSQSCCCGKAACWLPKTRLSPRPLALPTPPLGTSQPFGTGRSGGRTCTKRGFPSPPLSTRRPAAGLSSPTSRSALPQLPVPGVRRRDCPISPQPREPTSAATPRLPPSTTR